MASEYQQGTGGTPTWKQEFTYDRYGNRFQSGSGNTGMSVVTVVSSDITAATNRLISSGSTPVAYDAAGNITQDAKFQSMNYTYDANGRQISAAALGGSPSQTSVYDCVGQRVQTTSGGVTRTMVYDIFGQQVADYNGTTVQRENIYRAGQLLAVNEASGGLSYVLTDLQGSTRALMNNSGSGTSTITSRHDYLPFGEEIGAGVGLRTTTQKYSQSTSVRRRFAMLESDDVSGLDHSWFRKLENRAGRWTSPDLIGGNLSDPQSFNRYAYVQNDPVNLLDPSGLMPCVPGSTSAECDSSGFGGWGGGFDMNERRSSLPISFTGGSSGREIIDLGFNNSRFYWAFFRGIQYTGSDGTEHAYFWWEKVWSTAYFFGGNPSMDPTARDPRPGSGRLRSSGSPGPSTSASASGFWSRWWDCVNDFRFDNLVRHIGNSAGLPGVGEFAANLTLFGTGMAIGNQVLNLTSWGKYPRKGIGLPAGSPTSWQHRIGGEISRALEVPSIGRGARMVGRVAARASGVLIAFEVGYTVGTGIGCATFAP